MTETPYVEFGEARNGHARPHQDHAHTAHTQQHTPAATHAIKYDHSLRNIKLDRKTAFSAERTANAWLRLALSQGALALAILAATNTQSLRPSARFVAAALLPSTIFFAAWSAFTFRRRIRLLVPNSLASSAAFADVVGPSIAALSIAAVTLLNVFMTLTR